MIASIGKSLPFALILLSLMTRSTPAATYHVATSGDDANLGTRNAPWRTLQHAADSVIAGDDVLVSAGTYQGFRSNRGGSEGAPIRFLAAPGVRVNAPGPRNTNGDNVWVRNVDHIVIDGFESSGAARAGIAVQGEPWANATAVVIRNCFSHDNGRWGIFTGFARDLLIEDNETSFSAAEHGIYVSNSGDRPVVRRNHVHHNRASGIQLNADPAQLGDDPSDPQGDGIIEGALIEANLIHDNGAAGGAAINLASVRSSVIRNNLLFDNHATGIAGWDDGEGSNLYGTRDNLIAGNTIVQPSDGRFAVGLKNGSVHNRVWNNILLHTGSRGSLDVDPESREGLQSDYNVVVNVFSDDEIFFDLSHWRTLGFEAHSFIATPSALFVAGSYRLAQGSPAIDAGLSLLDLPDDLEGVSRPQGFGFDLGAYEAQNPSGLPSATPTPSPTVTRVPTVTRSPTRTATRRPTRSPTPSATRTRTRRPTRTRTPTATRVPSRTPTSSATRRPTRTPTATRGISADRVWQPRPGTSWQWQLSGEVDVSVDVQMYDIDLFDSPTGVIDRLHRDGRIVVCYFSAGSWEDWRSGADVFPDEVKGRRNGWPGERWLDIRRLDVLAPIMGARLDLAVAKGCEAVEPDNVDGYTNNTGFPLTPDDQLAFNI